MDDKLVIASDHAGFQLKQQLINHLTSKGYDVEDIGPFDESSVDYPDFAHPLAESVESNANNLGILICGSGNGVAMAANKHKNVRAAVCWNSEIAQLAKQHNNANVICLPARFISTEEAFNITSTFLDNEFEGGRHSRRVDKIRGV